MISYLLIMIFNFDIVFFEDVKQLMTSHFLSSKEGIVGFFILTSL